MSGVGLGWSWHCGPMQQSPQNPPEVSVPPHAGTTLHQVPVGKLGQVPPTEQSARSGYWISLTPLQS